MMMTMEEPTLHLERFDAVLFDVDGVVTDTAPLHAEAWKRTFDEFLARHGHEIGAELSPFDSTADYLRFVADRPRRDGLHAFLSSRGIGLAERNGPSGADADTMWSLAERKDRYFVERIEARGVEAFRDAVTFLRQLHHHGIAAAAVSASRNCGHLLAAAGIAQMFDVRVDGTELDRLRLPGKPDPAMFVEAAHRLGVPTRRTVVIEDALAGVEAGRRGGFEPVIGLDRAEILAGQMYERGADMVVRSLTDLVLVGQRAAAQVARR